MCEYAQQLITEGSTPPQENKKFFKKRGLVYLPKWDEWSQLMFSIWISSRVSTGFGVSIDTQTVFAYAKAYKQNKIETLETVKAIQNSIKEKTA